jgi:magnesium-protoporphyrin IX monomethyl ester (oxidative) cyclase
MKKIVLVHPPYPRKKGRGYLLGPGYIAAALEKMGREAVILDEPCFLYKQGAEELLRRIRAARPDAVGVALTSSSTVCWAYEFLNQLKRALPETPMAAGGLHATLLPEETLAAGFDFTVIGDGERTFPDLLSHIESGRPPHGIKGLAWKAPGGETVNTGPAYIEDLDSLPFPANKYFVERSGEKTEVNLSIILSRGCFRACTFCVERRLNRGVRFRSADNVMAEIADAWERRRITNIHFLDSSFLEEKSRVAELCRRMSEFGRTARFQWKCFARVDHLDPELLAAMKDAGCEDIYVGMESASDETLGKIRKKITVRENERAVELCLNAGIRPHGYLVVGFPWENESHFAANAAFRDRHGARLDTLFFVPVPYPGTELYDEFHERFGFTEWWVREKPAPAAISGRPLFRWLRCFDLFLERNFFHYDDLTWARLCGFLPSRREIETAGPGLKRAAHRAALKLMESASAALYRISPHIEHSLMHPVYNLFQWLFHQFRKRNLSEPEQ